MKLGAITLQNAVCLAAAPWDLAGEGYEQLGAIFTKTVTMEPRAGLPGDEGILQVADQTLLNRTDLRTEGAELLVQEHLPRLRRFGVPVFVSVTAPGVPGFRKIARYLQREAGEQLAGLEVYITVPPGGSGADVTARFVREATEAVRNELRDDAAVIVKLPPWPDHIRGLALGAQEGGATALAATNTLKVLHLPTDRNAAPLVGGLSGEALRPLALRCVWELAQDEKLALPIFGTGGIFTLRDVQDYLRVGAQAVQVASGEWLSPGLTARLASEVMHNVKYE
ncbi:dihydroorotate dehydrogenase [Hymenobacter segetis]|uniref:Dihydroorotate dehydrogenase catalytic domain-containing protein n=1 Tax=Hymenobacter segetis TaxID=2025509 RepID=A0ABU9LZY8_9BACT